MGEAAQLLRVHLVTKHNGQDVSFVPEFDGEAGGSCAIVWQHRKKVRRVLFCCFALYYEISLFRMNHSSYL